MFSKIERWLTFGNQYVAASVVYLGLALILGGSTLLDSLQEPLQLASHLGELLGKRDHQLLKLLDIVRNIALIIDHCET